MRTIFIVSPIKNCTSKFFMDGLLTGKANIVCANALLIKISREKIMKTYMANPATVERKWFVVDANGMALGRLASQVADMLTGKNKTIYTPHVDTGDFVIVINSDKVVLTGKKLEQKKLSWHTGFIGGLKEVDYKTLMEKNSCKVIEKAVKGMLPKNTIGRKQATRLYIYKDANHNHEAQKPEVVSLKGAN